MSALLDVQLPITRFVTWTVIATALSWLFHKLYIYPAWRSPTRNIPGPPAPSALLGHTTTLLKSDPELFNKWAEKYGGAFTLRGLLGQHILYVSDPRALTHILISHPNEYPKPEISQAQLRQAVGPGVLTVEGDVHKRQRRILNGPFTHAAVKSYQPVFHDQSVKLVSCLKSELEQASTKTAGSAVINILPWLNRTALDILGHAGFAYDFHSLDPNEESKLAKAFEGLLDPQNVGLVAILVQYIQAKLPFLEPLMSKLRIRMIRMVCELKRCIALESQKMMDIRTQWAADGELENKTDMLSLIVGANLMATNPKDRMLDDEVIGQIATFTVAAEGTSSIAVAWALVRLSQHKSLQAAVRAEIRESKSQAEAEGRSELSVDEILGLPTLEAVVREVLRIDPPVAMTIRQASKADTIPLSTPIKGRDGKPISCLQVARGQSILVGIAAVNKNRGMFGDNIDEFNPDRWTKDGRLGDVGPMRNLSVWSPLMTFLGGSRGCIGFRFALLEIKTILATLLDAFEFSERDEAGTPYVRRMSEGARPLIQGEENKGAQLPLAISRASRQAPET